MLCRKRLLFFRSCNAIICEKLQARFFGGKFVQARGILSQGNGAFFKQGSKLANISVSRGIHCCSTLQLGPLPPPPFCPIFVKPPPPTSQKIGIEEKKERIRFPEESRPFAPNEPQ